VLGGVFVTALYTVRMIFMRSMGRSGPGHQHGEHAEGHGQGPVLRTRLWAQHLPSPAQLHEDATGHDVHRAMVAIRMEKTAVGRSR